MAIQIYGCLPPVELDDEEDPMPAVVEQPAGVYCKKVQWLQSEAAMNYKKIYVLTVEYVGEEVSKQQTGYGI